MRKPDMKRLPRDFAEAYRKNVILRLAGSFLVLAAAAVFCLLTDFTGEGVPGKLSMPLRYPAGGPVGMIAAALVLDCLLFGLHRFFRPSWEGEILEAGAFSRVVSGNKGEPERRMMVELKVDRGEPAPHLVSLFRQDKVPHRSASGGGGGGREIAVNVFQLEAPYKVGDTLVMLRGLKYPARYGVKDAEKNFEPKFVCPFCGEINRGPRDTCYRCGRPMLK